MPSFDLIATTSRQILSQPCECVQRMIYLSGLMGGCSQAWGAAIAGREGRQKEGVWIGDQRALEVRRYWLCDTVYGHHFETRGLHRFHGLVDVLDTQLK